MSPKETDNQNDDLDVSRRNFLHAAGLASLALGVSAMPLTVNSAKAQTITPTKKTIGTIEPKPYNVLLVLTDQEQHLADMLGKGHWPGRDKLVSMGTTFNNHHACSMVCTPSRSVIFTGQHIQHTKMFDNTNYPWVEDMSYDIPTIGHMMRDAGYYTAYQGKWHLNEQLEQDIQQNKQLEFIGHDVMEKYGFSDFSGVGDVIGMTLGGYHADEFVTATATTWLRSKGRPLNDKDQPWFLTIGLVNPHDVMFFDTDGEGDDTQSSQRLLAPINKAPNNKVYSKKWDVPLSPSRKQPFDEPGRPKAHLDYHLSHSLLTGDFPNEDARWKRLQDYYYNCISDNDRSVETIMTELDNLNMLEETIVIFTSDHGELCGAHGMHGKGATAYQEQNNVSCIIYHPDIDGGQSCDALTSHLDIIPTILAMTGADKKQKPEVRENLRGHNFSKLLEQPAKADFDTVREANLFCYNMWSYMDADWFKKLGPNVLTESNFDLNKAPRPNQKKRSAIRSVFDGRYKYNRYFSPQEHNSPETLEEIFMVNDVELYDLQNDPHEMKNLARDKNKQDLILTMNAKMNRLIAAEVGVDDGSFLPPVDGVNWEVKRFDP